MKIKMKAAVSFFVLICLMSVSISALSESQSYMYDSKGRSYSCPASYIPEKRITGADIGVGKLSSPRDIYVGEDNLIYISDTENNRIIILDSEFNPKKIITNVMVDNNSEELSQPTGVFYGNDKLLYICDKGNNRILAVDNGLVTKRKITGEDLISVNENLEFKPEKVVVDKDGTIYAVSSDIYQGIMQFDETNKFKGFFAPNDVKVTLGVRVLSMWKGIFSKDQQDSMEKILPPPYNNIYINKDQYIFTTATNIDPGKEIKCMNSSGINILRTPQQMRGEVVFGDLETSYENNEVVTSKFIDIHSDENGVISALDETRGRVFQYDNECNMICVFGGKGESLGEFAQPVAIEKINGKYLVLDSENNSITVFSPTSYTKNIIEALSFYNRGLYEESVGLWENVLKQNDYFSIAYKSIGRAYLQQGNYSDAMMMLEKGNDKYFYSLALKEYRKDYVRHNFWWICIGIVIFIIILIYAVKKTRRWLISRK